MFLLLITRAVSYRMFLLLITRAVSYRMLLLLLLFLGGTRLPVFMLIGWRAANNHVVCSWAKYSWENDMEQALLTQLGYMDCLLERSYHLQTHSPAAVDPH